MEEREKYEEGKWKGKKEHKHFWNQMESQWVSEGKDLKVLLNKKKNKKTTPRSVNSRQQGKAKANKG